MFPETDRVENFLSVTRLHSRMSIRIYIFDFKKRTSKKRQNQARIQKKQKKLKKKENISGKSIKKINLLQPGEDFSSPTFPETRVFFGLIVLYCTALDSHILVAPNLTN